MADTVIILILLTAAGLALRACLRGRKSGSCPGGCSGCSANCARRQDKQV